LAAAEETAFPVGGVAEGRPAGDVIHNAAGVSAFVKGRGDFLVALVASSVPDLHGDLLALDVHVFDVEVGADSRSVFAGELGLAGEPIDQL
jgi:hypothetical protein